MKHLKSFENIKVPLDTSGSMSGNFIHYKRKYKVDDIVGYDKYLDAPPVIVEVLTVNTKSNYNPYFVHEIYPPNHTHSLQEDDLIDLTPEQQEEVDLHLDTKKYNL